MVMKKFSFSMLFIFVAVLVSTAQKSELLVKSSDKGLYLEHKVQPKESFYALGRMYNIDYKIIASFNSVDYNKGLFIDQKLRIPLTADNFVQTGNKGTPVYYKVKDKESLTSISQKNNNVSASNLRWWNNLATNEVKSDNKLIVGFIQSTVMKSITIAGKPNNESDITKQKTEPAKENKEEAPKNPAINETDLTKGNTNDSDVKSEKVKPVVTKEDVKPAVVIQEVKTNTIDQGYFSTHFKQQIKTKPAEKDETVTAGIFKTTSGWEDAKYYLLIDKVDPGTIIKIINPTNNKAIFAKVLGEMSGIRQNSGLDVRISNAAASALDIKEDNKFIVKINY